MVFKVALSLMNCSKRQQFKLNISRQSGAALLIGMVVLASVAAFYLMGQFGAKSQKQERQESRVESLAQAKKALIAYAVTYVDTHPGEMGFLPCPDTDALSGLNTDEGHQDTQCGAANMNSIGRLPYRALELGPQKDDANECLWYAVSGYYKISVKTQMLNEDSNGMLEVYNASGFKIYGNTAEDRVVALVIAPGLSLNQNRGIVDTNTEQCGGNYTASNYLDSGDAGAITVDNFNVSGADVVDDFIKAGTNSNTLNPNPFNDLLVTITRDEIWNAVKRRNNYQQSLRDLTREIAVCLKGYGDLSPS